MSENGAERTTAVGELGASGERFARAYVEAEVQIEIPREESVQNYSGQPCLGTIWNEKSSNPKPNLYEAEGPTALGSLNNNKENDPEEDESVPDWWPSWRLDTQSENELDAINDYIDSKVGWLFDRHSTIAKFIRIPVGVVLCGVGALASLPGVPGPGFAILGAGVAMVSGSLRMGKGIVRFGFKVMDYASRWTNHALSFGRRITNWTLKPWSLRRESQKMNENGQRIGRDRKAFDWGPDPQT